MDDTESSGTGSSGKTVPPGLTPWPKGVSGNPSGRPKGVSLTQAILRRLSEEDADKLVDALIKRARKSSKDFALLIERTDGKVTDKMEHSGNVTTEVHVNTGNPRKPAVE